MRRDGPATSKSNTKMLHLGMLRQGTTTERIVELLTRKYPDRLSPKTIARALGVNHGSVRSICIRLVRDGRIDRPQQGYYCAFPVAERMPVKDLHLHRIQLKWNDRECCSLGCTPTKVAAEGELEVLPRPGPPFGLKWRLTRGRGSQMMALEIWKDRELRFRWYRTTGTVVLTLRASERPLAHHEFLSFHSFMDGLFRGHYRVPIEVMPVMAQGMHFNYDLPFMRLEGVQDISLKVFRNFWIRMYQKGSQLRIEECMEEELPLVYAVKLMEEMGKRATELAIFREKVKREAIEYELQRKRDEERAEESDQTMFG